MQLIKKMIGTGMSLVLSTVLLFGGVSGNIGQAKTRPVLSKQKLVIKVGERAKLQLRHATGRVQWSVASGKGVVSLTQKSEKKVIVKGEKSGRAVVQAVVGKKSLKCQVRVKKVAASTEYSSERPVPVTDALLASAAPGAASSLPSESPATDVGTAAPGQNSEPTAIPDAPKKSSLPASSAQASMEVLQDSALNQEYRRYSFELTSAVIKKQAEKSETARQGGKAAEDNVIDQNIMISPASVMFAMDLCAVGARNNTLRQITELFAGAATPTSQQDLAGTATPTSQQDLAGTATSASQQDLAEAATPASQQAFASAMLQQINTSKFVDFSGANAIWSNRTILGDDISPDYLSDVQELFGAEAKSASFDEETKKEINQWVDTHTNHMIQQIIDELNPLDAMVLVNALAFEAEWAEQYEDYQVKEEGFTDASGKSQTVRMLNGSEGSYFESDQATGFLKYYKGGKYGFLVMLPKDAGTSGATLLGKMTGEDYQKFIDSRTGEYEVYTKLPEFSYDYETKLQDILAELGVKDAFSANAADFSGMKASGDRGIYLSQVLHKTHIELDKAGTKAAAVTAIIAKNGALPVDPMKIKKVYCDRPFAYAIVDTESMNPLFIGTVDY